MFILKCPECLSSHIDLQRDPSVIDSEVNQTLFQQIAVCVDCDCAWFYKYWEVYSKGKMWHVDIVDGKNIWPDEYKNA